MGTLADLPGVPADDDDDAASNQAAARARVLEVFSGIFRHPARPPADDPSGPGSGSERPYWRDRAGKFTRRPEQPPVPEVDDVLTLDDAADSAARGTSKLGATGRDVTGEHMKTPRPAPRPAENAAAFVNEVSFDCRPDCRCIRCRPYERPYWIGRRRRR